MFTKIIGACLALILAGCASSGMQQTVVHGNKELAKQVFDTPVVRIDSTVRKTALAEGTVREIDVTQVAMVGADGKPKPLFDPRTGTFVLVMQMVDSFVTNPLGRDIIMTAIPLVGNVINVEGQKSIAKKANCGGKGCEGGSGSGSQSAAGSSSNGTVAGAVNSQITINLGPSCAASGTCVPVGN